MCRGPHDRAERAAGDSAAVDGVASADYEKFGTPFNPPADLLDPAVQAEAEEDIKLAHLLTCAMDCSTLSRVCDIPIRGSNVQPKPLRDEQNLRGLPRLQEPGAEAELRACTEANKLIYCSTAQLHAQVDRGEGALGENPRNSLYWKFPRVQELVAKDCADYEYDACAQGGARAKKQRIRNYQHLAGSEATG